VRVDFNTITENLIESEIFGTVKGAFTGSTDHREGYFEYADGGTVFLDEIGNLSPQIQKKLLLPLDDHPVIRRMGSMKEIPINVRLIAATMLQAMNTGHSGSMSTLHANSTKDSLNRLETMALMSDIVMPLTAIRGQIASAVDLIIQMSRFADGSRRITEIMEIEGLNNEGNYLIRSLFVYALQGKDEASGKIRGNLNPTGTRPSFFKELSFYDLQMDPELFSSV
jgi:hypothetical protein